MKKFANGATHFVAAGAVIGGTIQLLMALVGPNNYYLAGASAVQITQVYSELTYMALTAIGFFLVAILLEFVVYAGKANTADDNDSVVLNIEETNRLLRQIENMLSEQ